MNLRARYLSPWLFLFLLTSALPVFAQVPSPEQFFGFKIGTDEKLARYDKIVEYFNAVAEKSQRVRAHNLGPTTLGKPFILAEVASEDTIAKRGFSFVLALAAACSVLEMGDIVHGSDVFFFHP